MSAPLGPRVALGSAPPHNAAMATVRVRGALPAEAAILAEMANDLNDHVGIHGRPFTPLVAELDGAVVGYAFFSAGAAWAMPSWSRSRRRLCEPAACRWSGACTRPTRARSSFTVGSARSLRRCASWASAASACAPWPPPRPNAGGASTVMYPSEDVDLPAGRRYDALDGELRGQDPAL